MKNALLFDTPRTGFSAMRIWTEERDPALDRYLLFRRRFTLKKAGIYTLSLFASTYYNLYVDGAFLHRGPVRRHELNACYDVLSVFLPAGEHTLALLVHRIDKPLAAHRVAAPSLWLEMRDRDGTTVLVSDAEWKGTLCDAFTSSERTFFSHADFREDVDLRRYPAGWETPGFDDSAWQNATVLGSVGDGGDVQKNYTPRPMPPFDYAEEPGRLSPRGSFSGTDPGKPFPECAQTRRYAWSGTEGEEGGFWIASFRATLSGTLRVRYTGARAGDELFLAYDDILDPANGLPRPNRISRQVDRFRLASPEGEIETFMPRGFRYVLIALTGAGQILSADALREEYPYTEGRTFLCSDDVLNEVFEQSARTQRICTIDGFTDCVNRERVLWLGDAYVDFLGACCTEPDEGLLLMTLFEHALGQKPSGAIGGYNSSDLNPDWLQMTAYALSWIHMLCDYLLYFGHEDKVIPLRDTVRELVRFLRGTLNENLLVEDGLNSASVYWNWGYEEAPGESLKVTAFLLYTLERMKSVPFFEGLLPEDLIAQMPAMRRNAFARFWDPARRLFHDGGQRGEPLTDLCTQDANLLAVASGICPEELVPELVEKCLDPAFVDAVGTGMKPPEEERHYAEKIVPSATMYGSLFVVRTLFEKGYDALAIRTLRAVWGEFHGEPTLPEMRRNGITSDLTNCHGWSGAPAFLLPQWALGLRPTAKGWSDAVFAPPSASGELSFAKGVAFAPQGRVIAQWSRWRGMLRVRVSAPAGLFVRVRVKDQEETVSGDTTLFFPCEG